MSDPLLFFHHVEKSFWRGSREIVVLADVTFEVHAGEVLAVWGQRGAGKTTLAMLAGGLLDPDAGAIELAAGPSGARRRRGTFLKEGVAWMQRMGPRTSDFETVLDCVALPLLGECSPRVARQRASAMLDRLGVGECGAAGWGALTDGERTLVTLARAMVRKPRLLIADDPTANLNVLQRAEVLSLLRHTADEEGLAVVLTVPDMPDVAAADKIGTLSEGRVVFASESPQMSGKVIDFPGSQRSA